MELWEVQQLAIALGLGLLVGFQREWTAPHVAGIRTFALITVLGALIGIVADVIGDWSISVGLVAVTAMIMLGNVLRFAENSQTEDEPGLTTEVAALVMYIVGVVIARDQTMLGVMVGGGTAVLLHWKAPMHRFVERFGAADVRAIIQLVLIALVILPALPNKSYGPYDVLNPFEVWLMVVLIVGISLSGYVAYRFLGTQSGALISGILGGLISSTATTVSYARLTHRQPSSSPLAAYVVMISSTIVFARVLVEVAVVSPGILPSIAPPLAVMMVGMVLISLGVYFFSRGEQGDVTIEEDPAGIKAAIVFGLLYAGVLFAVAAVREHFGERSLYAVAALSGLTDMDAITLSTAQMINKGHLNVDAGWRMILIGFLSNLVFKAAALLILADRGLFVRIAISFGIAGLGGVAMLIFWP